MKFDLSHLPKSVLRIGLAGAIASLFVATSSAQDERGKQLYANCVACHQADGSGMKLLNAPAISGLSEKYIAAQINKFKAGHRGGDPADATGMQMRPMSMLLTSEEDIAAVAKYVASLPSKPVEATLTGGNAETGKALYATCQACHGVDGAGNDLLNAPSLLNQYDWYLEAQIHKFKDGVRGGNPEDITGSQMRPMAMVLANDQAIKDVIAYIETLGK
ncbi:c-type cytochrome [Pelagicoccus albus]|uniref:C-type cytochrome n=1 Tax=Pelagicoccus albus TaxID=415222 RepID=A0A7X1B495_9BACT|nr:c-type cytochrome [Pelagicoccus albus]MBC2605139.1 c-type cytochrome [Pelagicoccus albus]